MSRCAAGDPAHDALHLRRVVGNARMLLKTHDQPCDPHVVEAACWLHDCVQLPKGQGRPGEAADRSADVAAQFLRALGISPAPTDLITDAIRTHSFSGGRAPLSSEGAVVQDADRLDALGAVGIARLWSTMVTLGGTMYAADDPAGTSRDLDDRRWALDHIERKLAKLADMMNTPAGRAEAQRRTAYILAYRTEFLREISALEDV